MKISVVIPAYNVEDYLAECIESVIRQTYQDFEIVLVDDGSVDQSGSICDQYMLLYPQKIKAIHTKNGGPFQARLIGIQESTGDFLAFLDADDCFCEDALEKILGCFKREQCDMVIFNTGECMAFSTIPVNHDLDKGAIFEGISKKELYYRVIEGLVPNCVWLRAVKAECIKIPEHFYQCNARHGEDLLFSVHLMTCCQKIVYMDEKLYYYRNRPGSAIHSFNIRRKESVKIVHTELEKYIDQWGMPELKPLHNARKVSGWISGLKLLMQNKKVMGRKAFKNELISISKDPYFCDAYNNMEKLKVSSYNRLLACLLYYKQYFLISVLYSGVSIVKKFKNRRKHDR